MIPSSPTEFVKRIEGFDIFDPLGNFFVCLFDFCGFDSNYSISFSFHRIIQITILFNCSSSLRFQTYQK